MRWTVAIILLTIPGLATAQEAVTLKFPAQVKGDVHRVSMDMRQSLRMCRLDLFGNDLKASNTSSASQLAYADEYLAVENAEVTSFRRRFEMASESVNDGSPNLMGIHGKTVLVDHRAGSQKVSWENGEPLSGAITRQLEDALKQGKDKLGGMASFEPLPNRPVKVGENWSIDVSAIVKDCETKHGCKLTGATGVGTLKETYKGPKGLCAKIEVHIRVPLKTINSGDHLVELNDGSGTFLDAAYDFALGDSDSTYQSSMRLTFLAAGTTPEGDGTSTRLRMEMTVDLKEHRTGSR